MMEHFHNFNKWIQTLLALWICVQHNQGPNNTIIAQKFSNVEIVWLIISVFYILHDSWTNVCLILFDEMKSFRDKESCFSTLEDSTPHALLQKFIKQNHMIHIFRVKHFRESWINPCSILVLNRSLAFPKDQKHMHDSKIHEHRNHLIHIFRVSDFRESSMSVFLILLMGTKCF